MSIFVVGAGISGLVLSIELAQYRDVYLVSKSSYNASSSYWAQGGIACSWSSDDSSQDHLRDTFVASGNTSDRGSAYSIIERGRESVEWLFSHGFSCTKINNLGVHLAQEGGHCRRRIVHCKDITGAAIVEALYSMAKNHPRIHLMENTRALNIFHKDKKCTGIQLFNTDQQKITSYDTSHVVLACGGLGQVYSHSTNPSTNTGDGIALAWKTGCAVVNLEFIQFHPTGFYTPKGTPFLVTEALRGEGGKICNKNGYNFIKDFDKRGDLAPRDTVSRAISCYLQEHPEENCVYLDATHKTPSFLKKNFPNLYRCCRNYDIDITQDYIPVIPSAHYCCGGVKTNYHGETDIKSLWAIGEMAYTGLHGANRLASNSLLECIVMGRRCAKSILSKEASPVTIRSEMSISASPTKPEQNVIATIQNIMSQYVGIVRSTNNLRIAADKLSSIVCPNENTDAHSIHMCAQLIVMSSQQRKNNYGCYYNKDFKTNTSVFHPTYLFP
ncbi:putative L-aspartate oxidase [Candidatus Ichthyocystis hellenicum]|uniref:L-aspartate oxidase n=1 Tax=Candidatus Ichthyocystis hellenicum TaxID=1561003 RepID=A0A0S4M802_9BURK|nr:L-aspartate oxidase [Candidatus Ichthyocystis hellenicum]CUT17508.1 putative L-aspartate oxidase [Candidatus Ichthyocystis hellenicum]